MNATIRKKFVKRGKLCVLKFIQDEYKRNINKEVHKLEVPLNSSRIFLLQVSKKSL